MQEKIIGLIKKYFLNLLADLWRNWFAVPSSPGQTLNFKNVINFSCFKVLDEKRI